MSPAFIAMTVLLSSSVVIAFILQPSNEEPAAVHPRRCQRELRQSVKRRLLDGLGLQAEPRLAAGGLDGVREQWQRTFSTMSHRVKSLAPQATPSSPMSPDAGNSTSPKCCTLTSEVSMTDLGFDSWVLQPQSLTIVQCAPCSSDDDTAEYPSPLSGSHDANAQEQSPCCHPTSYEMVPILYIDEHSTVVISSVRLPRTCGCEAGSAQQPGTE
ncbi:unnamed protein product [Ophioblennius macclurei]